MRWSLSCLIAAQRPDRLERAAARWHGRLEVEAKALTLAESRFALAALERLPAEPRDRWSVGASV
jgi:hypothetical protein